MSDLTNEEIMVWICKESISELPADQEEACNEVAEHFRQVIKRAGKPVATLAFALVGAEMKAEACK